MLGPDWRASQSGLPALRFSFCSAVQRCVTVLDCRQISWAPRIFRCRALLSCWVQNMLWRCLVEISKTFSGTNVKRSLKTPLCNDDGPGQTIPCPAKYGGRHVYDFQQAIFESFDHMTHVLHASVYSRVPYMVTINLFRSIHLFIGRICDFCMMSHLWIFEQNIQTHNALSCVRNSDFRNGVR